MMNQELKTVNHCSCQDFGEVKKLDASRVDSSISIGLRLFWSLLLSGSVLVVWLTWTIGYHRYWNTLLESLRFLILVILFPLFFLFLVHFTKKIKATVLWKLVVGLYELFWKVYNMFWKTVQKAGIAGSIDKENVMKSCLKSLYFTDQELEREEELVQHSLSVKRQCIQNSVKHVVTTVTTGSVFERFGKSLSKQSGFFEQWKGDDNLKSDYDVMICFHATALPITVLTISDEYVYLYGLTNKCEFVKVLQDNNSDTRLSASKAREYLNNIVRKTVAENIPESLTHLNGFSSYKIIRVLEYLKTSIVANILKCCFFEYWTKAVTIIRGPATNVSMKRISLNPANLIKFSPYLRCLDFDFVLGIELPSWPESALEWISRPRVWPAQDVVASVVATSCSVVPKTGPLADPFGWRLSFSRGEVLLSQELPEHARLAFISIKLLFKNKIKPSCSFLRSYHLKTLFYNFYETEKEVGNWESISFDFLMFVEKSISKQYCPHYFIKTLNLFDYSQLQISNEEHNSCLVIIRKALQDFPLSIYDEISDKSKTAQFLTIFHKSYPLRFYACQLILSILMFVCIYPIWVAFAFSVYIILTYLIVTPICAVFKLNPDTSSHVILTFLFLIYVNRKYGLIFLFLFLVVIEDWGFMCWYIGYYPAKCQKLKENLFSFNF